MFSIPAILRIFAILGPAFVIWRVVYRPKSLLTTYAAAFHRYAEQASSATGENLQHVYAGFAFNLSFSVVALIAAALLLRHHRLGRKVAIVLAAILTVFCVVSGVRYLVESAWVDSALEFASSVYYGSIVLIFTRGPVARLFSGIREPRGASLQ
jgi:lipopolysaccharide export LptBFGC system permease protein LptF